MNNSIPILTGARLADTTTPPAPPTTPTPAITIPPIKPDFSAPGVSGLASFGNTLAAWVLVLAVIAILIGVLIAVVGPRFGFHGAKAIGMGGVIGGFVVGGVVALATPGVQTVYGWFA